MEKEKAHRKNNVSPWGTIWLARWRKNMGRDHHPFSMEDEKPRGRLNSRTD